jgi:hypothetical protein
VVHKWNERGSKDEDEIDAKVKFFSLMNLDTLIVTIFHRQLFLREVLYNPQKILKIDTTPLKGLVLAFIKNLSPYPQQVF